MKLKAFVKNQEGSLSDVLLRIPADTYKDVCKDTGLPVREVYVVSTWFSGIWVKANKNSDRVYPLQISPGCILEWEVVKKRK